MYAEVDDIAVCVDAVDGDVGVGEGDGVKVPGYVLASPIRLGNGVETRAENAAISGGDF